MLLEGLPAIVVFAPLLLPVAETLHINSLQYGIVLLIAMGIGSFAPPIGAGLYVAAAIGETSVTKVMRPAWFYTAILLVGILVIAVAPAITTALPSAFGRG
jgi:TRAP-type C4-dicarboxylate transport system permease large subunit